ncbi:amidohydrolase family protein [Paenibacillus silvisoli]|uniref:amidohydrolase family protein n=1 Tax=Paenibacillus silvisoli TaxID=3110539 RepID=UPI002803FB5B|nr:amidohydrolase family protein [Paenibacillus silvisoli]
MIIDAHQHYWKLDRGDYGWLTPEVGETLYRDYMPENVRSEMDRCGVTGAIIVQAAPTIAETEFLLELCELDEKLIGVVGWLDLNGSDFEKHYVRLRSSRRFIGIRPNFPSVPDGDWSRYPQIIHNLTLIAEDRFPVDLLIRPSVYPDMIGMLKCVPGLWAIIDHLGVPSIENGVDLEWRVGLEQMAAYEHVYCKLSGLATGSGGRAWKAAEVKPYVKLANDMFGSKRLLFGSDWPVSLQAGGYGDMLELAREVLPSEWSSAEIEDVFGRNAIQFYQLERKEVLPG